MFIVITVILPSQVIMLILSSAHTAGEDTSHISHARNFHVFRPCMHEKVKQWFLRGQKSIIHCLQFWGVKIRLSHLLEPRRPKVKLATASAIELGLRALRQQPRLVGCNRALEN